MVSKVLGKVSISPKGSFSADAQYSALDEVSHLGGSWLCLKSALGIEPGVSSGWEAYWMSVAIGIKDIVISSPAEGQTQITIVCSNGQEYSSIFNNLDIPDGSITTEKMAPGAVGTENLAANAVIAAKIKNGEVTWEKLAAALQTVINNKAPQTQYGTGDLTAGTTALATGTLYAVYE